MQSGAYLGHLAVCYNHARMILGMTCIPEASSTDGALPCVSSPICMLLAPAGTVTSSKMERGELYDACVKNTVQIDKEGYVHLPNKPGLGVELDFGEIKKRTVRRGELRLPVVRTGGTG